MPVRSSAPFRHLFTASLALALFAVRLASAQTPPTDTLTPRDVAALRAVDSPKISPDGSKIAYILSVPRNPFATEPDEKFEDGGAYAELHVYDLAAGASRPFIVGKVNIGQLKWSPSGDAIYFIDKRGDDKHNSLYRIPIDGGEARRVLTHETDIQSYTLSPDAAHVAFRATAKTPKDKEALTDAGFKAEVYEEDLDPTRVWVASLDDKKNEPKSLPIDGHVVAVEWSPAKDQLCVSLSPTSLIDDIYMRTRVRIVDADSGEVVTTIDNPGKLGRVAWSPDGRHVAMISAADINDPAEGRLLLADAQTGKLKDLLPDYKGHVAAIDWQDDRTVMFIGDEGLSSTFGKVGIDGAGRKTIVTAGDLVLGGFSLSKDGQSGAFVGASHAHPSELFAMKHGETQPRRLTDSNTWLAEKRFAKQEAISYEARDGQDIQGILIHPLDEKPDAKYPLIVYVHGGPEAHEYNAWLTNYSRPGQVAAARGFAVFYPNYRGSTGRGVEFSKLGQGDEAGKEFNDLVDGVKHLIDTGLVDKEKVGITGGSYGGYASAWGATALTQHFAASVMFVGISDSISKKGTTDIPSEDYLVHTRDHPWNDKWNFYRERSPIYYVKKARTPILILGGADDTRVHPGQSMELYRFLKTIGKVPVRLIRYPGEGHGNRKAAARLDYNLRMMQWMEHYLIGPGGDPPPMKLDYGLPEKAEDKSESDEASDEKS